MVAPEAVSKLCDNLELINFIVSSSMIHCGQLRLTDTLEKGLNEKLKDVQVTISEIKDTDMYESDQYFHNCISDIEIFLDRVETTISTSKTQQFIETHI